MRIVGPSGQRPCTSEGWVRRALPVVKARFLLTLQGEGRGKKCIQRTLGKIIGHYGIVGWEIIQENVHN